MSLHPRALFLFLWPEGDDITRVPINRVPVTWWPLLQPLRWYQSFLARQYVIDCEHFEVAITDNALLAAESRYAVVELVYAAIVRLGHTVAAYHQGLFARELRGHLDDHGYLFPAPAGPPWYHPADGHSAP